MSRVRRLLLAAGMSALACTPLTYSDAGAVDFGKYRSVRVSVMSTRDPVLATVYLADELRTVSGFFRVTVDSSVEVDAALYVYVSATPVTTTNEDGSTDNEFSSEASYRLSSPKNSIVDSGTTTDQSESEEEAIQDALDQIAAHYIRPYRL
jgi:hypothetical protein